MDGSVTIIGGGFAGVEAAWAAASRGSRVVLHEMRPARMTAVHQTGDLAELVCSNSFKSDLPTNASGILKREMRALGSLTLAVAERHRVPAGEALAVDREPFAREITARLGAHPCVHIVRGEVTEVPASRPLVLATGPLTSESLATSMARITGAESLYFYDAVAPTITLESIDTSKVFRASRRGRHTALPNADSEGGPGRATGEEGDYLNCPMAREEYLAFHQALAGAEVSASHNPEDEGVPYFEMCLPVEELARRGPRTLAYGPMKPIGLTDPRTGQRPYAVVQLRQENRDGTLWGLVGFQSRLKWGEQRRVFRMIPGLEGAEFVRYGVMHRNTYVCSPRILGLDAQLREHPGVFLAGQITGVEGYLESAAIGIVAGLNAHRTLAGEPAVTPPRPTALGSLCHYLVETPPAHFAPMNANFGIMPELDQPVRDKRRKAEARSERARAEMDHWLAEVR
ncbi:MAG: methylenetetrahydrofolate--tRNA-(uracil(54)-C(5))-methyltransferase (FADH(2)-oxidizing) TrmFO [Chthonomonadales bacterium]|nr:methylenetetrahydrofolate--tRNA-(uracil(54)-C(5))-methyltransferase (FADH(2)-oxidizing) TrmFO [Chthonomonadales bacterium]